MAEPASKGRKRAAGPGRAPLQLCNALPADPRGNGKRRRATGPEHPCQPRPISGEAAEAPPSTAPTPTPTSQPAVSALRGRAVCWFFLDKLSAANRRRVAAKFSARFACEVVAEPSPRLTHVVTSGELGFGAVCDRLGQAGHADVLRAIEDGTAALVSVKALFRCFEVQSCGPLSFQAFQLKGESSVPVETQPPPLSAALSFKYACQRPAPMDNPNSALTDALEILEQQRYIEEKPASALAYRRASSSLKIAGPVLGMVTNVSQLNGIKYINTKARAIIADVMAHGESEAAARIASSSEYQAVCALTSLWGVGFKTAKALCSRGFMSVGELSEEDLRDERAKVSLRYRADLQEGIGRREVQRLEAFFRELCAELSSEISVTACGGYRRGKALCKDVDLLVSHPSDALVAGLLLRIRTLLQERGLVIYEQLDTNQNTNKNLVEAHCRHRRSSSFYKGVKALDYLDKSMLVMRCPWSGKARRIDVIVAPQWQYPTAALGWTGSKHFNRSLRLYAKEEMGMCLTSHGITKLDAPGNHESGLHFLPLTCEEDIFAALGLDYIPPEQRNL